MKKITEYLTVRKTQIAALSLLAFLVVTMVLISKPKYGIDLNFNGMRHQIMFSTNGVSTELWNAPHLDVSKQRYFIQFFTCSECYIITSMYQTKNTRGESDPRWSIIVMGKNTWLEIGNRNEK